MKQEISKNPINWGNTVVYRRSLSETEAPAPGYAKAHCNVNVDVRGKLLKQIVQDAIMKSTESAAEKLESELGGALSFQDCLSWVLKVRKVKELEISRAENYTGNLPPLSLKGDFWAKPDEVRRRPGWSIEGENPVKIEEKDQTTDESSRAAQAAFS